MVERMKKRTDGEMKGKKVLKDVKRKGIVVVDKNLTF